MSVVDPAIETTDFVLIGKSSIRGNRLCLHKVKNEKIGAETPFLKETAQKIFAQFSEYKEEHKPKIFEGLIPKNIILANDTATNGLAIIWTVEKQYKKLSFGSDCKKEGLNFDYYSIPKLLFYFKNSHLWVYAISDDTTFIDENTPLFKAPFYNVYENGSICMGNVNLQKAKKFLSFNKIQVYLENVFFQSFFTHSNDKAITVDYILKNQNAKFWNKKNLFSTELTIKTIL